MIERDVAPTVATLDPIAARLYSGPSGQRTIMVVDDDATNRELIGIVLRQSGFQVLTYGEPSEALSVAQSATPIDLLITDQIMPRQTGIELGLTLQCLRPTLPVLLMSGGLLQPESIAQLRCIGWSLLDKPFRLPDLLASVSRLLSGEKRMFSDGRG